MDSGDGGVCSLECILIISFGIKDTKLFVFSSSQNNHCDMLDIKIF